MEEREWAYRRWVLLKEKGLLSDVLTLFLRAVFALQRRRARRQGVRGGQTGAVSFLQFFGSALQVTPHDPALVPEGVFVPGEGGVRFEALLADTKRYIRRILREEAGMRLLSAARWEDSHERFSVSPNPMVDNGSRASAWTRPHGVAGAV